MMAQDGVLDALLTQLCQPEVNEAEAELRITEQPKTKGFRFRYNCEGLSHGGLPGEHSQKGRRTYPSVEIVNFVGEARIVVSLVTDEPEPKPHAHSLVGRNCSNGICTVQVGPSDMTACFQSLMIQHATKRDAIPILQRRILEHQQIRNMILGVSAEPQLSIAEAEDRAKAMAKDMDLSKVRLCFQAYLKDLSGRFTHSLPPVLSNVVYDSHAPNATALKICRMDRSSGSTRGGEEVYLLCDKVQKDDIEVRFFEVNPNGEMIWEGYGDFAPTDVHRQYAIVFKTPPFKEETINKPVGVHVQLRRKSDLEVSEPKPFTYHSPIKDAERLSCKRVKRCYPFDTSECLLRDIVRGTGSSPDMMFGLQPNNQSDIKSMVLCKGAGGMQHSPHAADGKTPYMSGVTQPQMNGVMVGQQQHPQVAPNQQVNIQNQQLLAAHHQNQQQQASPQQQHSEQVRNQQFLLMESRLHAIRQQQQQQGNLNQQQQQQVVPSVQHPNQGTQHQQNSQMQQVLQQSQQQHLNHQQQPQQSNQHQVLGQQKLLLHHQRNGFQGKTLAVHPRLSSKGVKVKKEPLECTELKENLPKMDTETADSKSDTKETGLEFPTDIRSDACPMNLPANIEADASVDETASRKDKEIEMMKSQRRTMEWQKDFGIDENIDDGQEKEINRSKKDLSFQEEGLEEKHLPGEEILHSELIEKLLSSNTEYEEGFMRLAEQLSNALLRYSQTGDTRTLLQAQKHLLSTEDENGDTPLHLAVIHKQPEALKAILSVVVTIKGQTLVNQKNKLDQIPLHLSVITKSAEMVQMLLGSGADPNILDQNGYNSLHLAVDGRFHAAIGALIDGSSDAHGTRTIPVDKDALNLSGYSALHMAVENRDITAARNLIQSGANKDIPDGKSGRVPLHCAVLAEDYTMLSYLVADAKVDIHAEDFSSNTPLHLAAAYDLSAVAALLIAAGANPDSRNWDVINDDSDDSCMNEDCEWEDGDCEDEEGDSGERLGSSALDYAKSDQMRRVLLGESYIPTVTSSSSSLESKSGSVTDLLRTSSYSDSSKPVRSSSSGSCIESGIHSEGRFKSDSLQERSIRQRGGDISSLSDKLKNSLVEALDSRYSSTNDWRAFASHLGMGNMVNHLRVFDSPTKILLGQYQLMDGTLAELCQVANMIGRKDVVEILNNAMNEVGRK